MRRVAAKVLRRAVVSRRAWFRCAMVGLALGYAAEYVTLNGPYWEPDTDYLHWSTDVPTVTVCQAASSSPRDTRQPSVGQSAPKYSEIDDTVSEQILKRTKDFKKKGSLVVCENIFKNCSWNGKDFNCCRHFQPHRFVVETPCFSINSLQTINRMKKKLAVSHFSKNGQLKMEFNEPVEVSLHGPEEVRFGELQKQYLAVDLHQELKLLYATRQIVEHVSLATLGLSARGCLLRGEKKLHSHPVYGKTACLLECAVRDPELFYDDAINFTRCDCPPTCTAMEIRSIWNETQRSVDNATKCVLTMSKPATERLVMKAKYDYVDLIVKFACLLQLFAGINLLDIPKFISDTRRHDDAIVSKQRNSH